MSAQSRHVRPHLSLKWTGTRVFSACWAFYLINLELCLKALLDLSRTLFFAGFHIWNKRQQLASRFWKDIAPQNREIMDSNGKKRKRRKLDDDNAKSNCKNPFHFLRRYRNLSNKRRTKCPCSNASKESKEMPNQSITTFINLSMRSTKASSETKPFQSRADKIRAEHDRGKKRKTRDS